MAPDDIKLAGLHRAEFELAKTDQARAWKAQVAVVALALISSLVPDEILTYAFAVLALLSAGVSWFFSWRSKGRVETAHRVRRGLILMHGLGWRISSKERADLLASFSASEAEGRRWENESYFDPVDNPCPQAFAKLIQQNVFWSKHLYSQSARRYWLYLSLLMALLFVVLFSIPLVPRQEWGMIIAHTVSLALMFMITIDILGRAISYSHAFHVLGNIDDRLITMAESDASEPDTIFVFADYNAIVQGTSMIPTDIYNRIRRECCLYN